MMILGKNAGFIATSFLLALSVASSSFVAKGEEDSAPSEEVKPASLDEEPVASEGGENVDDEATETPEYKIKDIMKKLNGFMKAIELVLEEYDSEIPPSEKIDQMIALTLQMEPLLIELIELVPAKIMSLEFSDPNQFFVRKSEYQFYITKTLNYFLQLKHYFYLIVHHEYTDEVTYDKAHKLYFRKIIPLIKKSHFRFG